MTTAASQQADEPLVPAVTPARTRRRRWPFVVVGVLLLLVAAWLWVVSPVARSLVVGRLRAAGFREVDVAAMQVGFGTVRATQLRLGGDGGGEVVVPTVIAEYTLGGVFAGQLQSLTLEGPQWVMSDTKTASPFDTLVGGGGGGEAGGPVTALPPLPVGRLTIRNGRVQPGAHGAVPAIAFDGEITAGATHWDVALRAAGAGQGLQLNAQLDVSPERANGTLTLRAVGERPLELHGTLRSEVVDGARVLGVELRREPSPFDVHVGGTTWTGDGTMVLQANVPLASLADATVDLTLDGVSVEGSNGFSLAGLASTVKLLGLPIPDAASPLQASWRSASFAKLSVGEGKAELDLQGLQLVGRVDQKTSDGSGTITFNGLRYAVGAGSIPAHVVFERVPLKEWLEALSKGRITGEGRLSGNVDLAVRWAPRLDIDLQGGHLTSEGGIVHFLEDEETTGMIRAHVEQIAEASGHGNIVKERLVGALQEFAYRTLDFRLEPEAGGQGVTLRVHTAGKGRVVPQELDLTVNLHGFDAALDTALALKLGLDRAKQRLDDKIEHKNDEAKPRNEQR